MKKLAVVAIGENSLITDPYNLKMAADGNKGTHIVADSSVNVISLDEII